MPIPFAHPAAVLPLRRYCGRWLNFPALVIGSIVPDVGYLFDDHGWGGLSHQWLGSLAFGFPIGILLLSALYGFRSSAVNVFPAAQKRTFVRLCTRPIGPLWIVAISLLIGIWSHVLWDSFTHSDGQAVERFAILQVPVFQFAGRTAKVCHLLWYASSFAGVGWLVAAFEHWKQQGASVLRDSIILALLVVPVSMIHHLIRGTFGMVLTGALCAMLALPFILKSGTRDPIY